MKNLPADIRESLASSWFPEPSRLTFLGGGEDWSDGTVFTAPGPSGPLVLKVLDFPPDDAAPLDRAEARIRLVDFLGAEGCPIVAPVPDSDGSLFRTVTADARFFLAYAYPFVVGRSVEPADPTASDGWWAEAYGGLVGRLHAGSLARGVGVLSDGSDPEFPRLGGWRTEVAFFRSWCRDPAVQAVWDRLAAELEGIAVRPDEYGFVHNDLHRGNLLFDPEAAEPRLTVIDFDVANGHWFAAECATALLSLETLAPDAVPGNTEAFWRGYRRHRVPSAAELSRLGLFRLYRRCLQFTASYTFLETDPVLLARRRAVIAEEERRVLA